MVTNKLYLTKTIDGETVKLKKGSHKVSITVDEFGQIQNMNGHCLTVVSNILTKVH